MARPATALPGWTRAESPFHAGEQAVQERSGMRARMEEVGRRLVRDFMPDQHRELFETLPYLFVGSEDDRGFVWASMLAGAPGFVSSPDARTLSVELPGRLAPPLDVLSAGAKLGLLGIELATKRRNRANGSVRAANEHGFTLHVEQSFGNCAQYIHARDVTVGGGDEHDARPQGALLSSAAVDLVERADTFFIATTSGGGAGSAQGLDVSHRGGPPGFVRVSSDGQRSLLRWPDYRGNFMFCTLGNLELDPRAGLLFVDFESRASLALTGLASVRESEAGRELCFAVSHGTSKLRPP